MPFTELIHSKGNPRLTLVRPPIVRYLVPEGTTGIVFDFTTPCASYSIIPLDERGTTHHTETGRVVQTRPKHRLRIDLIWNYIRTGKVTGGIPERIATENHNEYELIAYLETHKHEFSDAGDSELWVVVNHLVGSHVLNEDAMWRVAVIGTSYSTSNPAEVHGASLSLESMGYEDVPYKISYNRDGSPW